MDDKPAQNDLIKIGQFWLLSTVLPQFEHHQRLRQYVANMKKLGYTPKQYEHQYEILMLFKFQILPRIVKTSHQNCTWIEPSKLVNIHFTNLRFLHLNDQRLFNIECLQFIDLRNLQTLKFKGLESQKSQSRRNILRSITPLVKCRMPKLNRLSFASESYNSNVKNISRINTSDRMQMLPSKFEQPLSFREDGILDNDMSIWAKFETKKKFYFNLYSNSNAYYSGRIRQGRVASCLCGKSKQITIYYDEEISSSEFIEWN